MALIICMLYICILHLSCPRCFSLRQTREDLHIINRSIEFMILMSYDPFNFYVVVFILVRFSAFSQQQLV